jgi:hypothetical protein
LNKTKVFVSKLTAFLSNKMAVVINFLNCEREHIRNKFRLAMKDRTITVLSSAA